MADFLLSVAFCDDFFNAGDRPIELFRPSTFRLEPDVAVRDFVLASDFLGDPLKGFCLDEDPEALEGRTIRRFSPLYTRT